MRCNVEEKRYVVAFQEEGTRLDVYLTKELGQCASQWEAR